MNSSISGLRFLVVFVLFFLLFTACKQNVLMDENLAVDTDGWDFRNKAGFELEVEDTLALHAFYLNVRQKESYRYSNLYIFLHTTFPNGTITHDTIECVLAKPDGKWLGRSSGNYISNQILLNESLRFPLSGQYRFEIEQAMREEKLQGIADIGLRIEIIN
ncbi:MAG: gliding motility lipoprotein GldH [Bacteroidales bacterium]|jgi:gliding motility-associated lipoprotein GldH|nr:gliding motility lipoprotein GldH [Bacteroidales bacterium]HOI33178.1 gliding motility lipoprotein GldH [Bacteroidales bacterium]